MEIRNVKLTEVTFDKDTKMRFPAGESEGFDQPIPAKLVFDTAKGPKEMVIHVLHLKVVDKGKVSLLVHIPK